MTNDEKRKELERMMKHCPEILTPGKVAKWSPFGKNRVYALLKTGELRSFIYQGGYIVAKSDLIDYLIEHSNDKSNRRYTIDHEHSED
ncbi:MAG: helix-turn-helix domain-containing protein [Ruminococcus sp.]|nr:helix-turn-helix domain-containing protein [Ruminococcus sp.]